MHEIVVVEELEALQDLKHHCLITISLGSLILLRYSLMDPAVMSSVININSGKSDSFKYFLFSSEIVLERFS